MKRIKQEKDSQYNSNTIRITNTKLLLYTMDPRIMNKKGGMEISEDPNKFGTHFIRTTKPNKKGQTRYQCLTCSHEFTCSGKKRRIQHIIGKEFCLGKERNVSPCPNPYLPLKANLLKIYNSDNMSGDNNTSTRKSSLDVHDIYAPEFIQYLLEVLNKPEILQHEPLGEDPEKYKNIHFGSSSNNNSHHHYKKRRTDDPFRSSSFDSNDDDEEEERGFFNDIYNSGLCSPAFVSTSHTTTTTTCSSSFLTNAHIPATPQEVESEKQFFDGLKADRLFLKDLLNPAPHLPIQFAKTDFDRLTIEEEREQRKEFQKLDSLDWKFL
jgi:hypothetical protein